MAALAVEGIDLFTHCGPLETIGEARCLLLSRE
jgi:hypothetical protein